MARASVCASDAEVIALCSSWGTHVASGPSNGLRAALQSGTVTGARADGGVTALMLCCERGAVEKMALLLSSGADVSSRDSHGRAALSYAAREGTPSIISALLAAGADRRIRDNDGIGPAALAKALHGEAIAALLR